MEIDFDSDEDNKIELSELKDGKTVERDKREGGIKELEDVVVDTRGNNKGSFFPFYFAQIFQKKK